MRPRPRALDRPGTATTTAWLVTLVATVVSAYALDAIAAAAGVALAGSGLLQGLDAWRAADAAARRRTSSWAAALRVNLRANWDLLQQTGTSTNALSKAAHDVARRRGATVRTRRIAAGTGYVGTEVAKEVPYYAGAFGARSPTR